MELLQKRKFCSRIERRNLVGFAFTTGFKRGCQFKSESLSVMVAVHSAAVCTVDSWTENSLLITRSTTWLQSARSWLLAFSVSCFCSWGLSWSSPSVPCSSTSTPLMMNLILLSSGMASSLTSGWLFTPLSSPCLQCFYSLCLSVLPLSSRPFSRILHKPKTPL